MITEAAAHRRWLCRALERGSDVRPTDDRGRPRTLVLCRPPLARPSGLLWMLTLAEHVALYCIKARRIAGISRHVAAGRSYAFWPTALVNPVYRIGRWRSVSVGRDSGVEYLPLGARVVWTVVLILLC